MHLISIQLRHSIMRAIMCDFKFFMNQVADCISASPRVSYVCIAYVVRRIRVSMVHPCNDYEAFGASATKDKLRDKILVVKYMLTIMYELILLSKKRYLHIQGYFRVSMYTYICSFVKKSMCIYSSQISMYIYTSIQKVCVRTSIQKRVY